MAYGKWLHHPVKQVRANWRFIREWVLAPERMHVLGLLDLSFAGAGLFKARGSLAPCGM
jgi:hypothetical protein